MRRRRTRPALRPRVSASSSSPASNMRPDAYHAVSTFAGAEPVYLWHQDTDLKGVDAIVCPAASPTATTCAAARSRASARSWRRSPSSPRDGGLVIGICNGFQILIEAGLLPGALHAQHRPAVRLPATSTCGSRTPTRRSPRACAQGDVLRIADHARRGQLLRRPGDAGALEANGQVVLRYCDAGRQRRRSQPQRLARQHRRRLQRGRQRVRHDAAPRDSVEARCRRQPTAAASSSRWSTPAQRGGDGVTSDRPS